MTPQEVLEAFARKHGLGGCVYDQDGLCRLILDSDLCVDLEIQGNGSVLMHGAAGPVDMDNPALLADLLNANLLYAPEAPVVIALDRYLGEVILLRLVEPDQTVETFERILNDFAAAMAEWKEGLENPDLDFIPGPAANGGEDARLSVPPPGSFA